MKTLHWETGGRVLPTDLMDCPTIVMWLELSKGYERALLS